MASFTDYTDSTSSSCTSAPYLYHTDPSTHQHHASPIRGETALWRAVITQALMDASSNSAKDEAKNDKMKALRWLCSNSQDFKTICYYAGYDPVYLKKKIISALSRNCSWRAPSSSQQPPHRRPIKN